MRSLHQLAAATVAALGLLLLAAPPRSAAAQTLPGARDLMEKNDAAIGGRAALAKHTSFHQVGSMTVATAGIQAQIELFKLKPTKYLQKIVLGAIGEVTQGYDGKTAWTIQPGQAAAVLDSASAETFKSLADFFGNFHDQAKYKSIETVGIVDFEGGKCYKVKIVKLTGSEGFEYFDVATGLIAGVQAAIDTPMGKIDQTSVFSDYRDFGGLKMPTKIQQKNGQFDATISFTTIEFDNVDPAVFELPASLKATVKP